MALIHERMAAIMKAADGISKSNKNQQQGFMFRGIDDVYNTLHKIMAEHEVFTLTEVLEDRTEERTTRSGGALIYRILKIRYSFYTVDGSSVSSVVIGEGMDSGDKASNKAMAIAHKYALLQAWCIPTEEQKDPDHECHEVTPKAAKAPQKAPEAPHKASGSQKPSTPAKTSNYGFLQTMGELKANVGRDAYYRVLEEYGFTHADKITARADQVKIYEVLCALPTLDETDDIPY